ncbi:MAG: DUF2851 family protein [Saprospiraceae bacterium]|nr:DUF2851 family protein [Saprospiraceae bacterium]
MTEEFLHYLWKYNLIDKNLKLQSGEDVIIVNQGEHNTDSGPDFFNAKVRIGETLWAGNVEIHINSSDWIRHNHSNDKAYDNIILHVVFNHDLDLYRINNELIPVVELKDKFNKKLLEKYKEFIFSKTWIPCVNQISSVDTFTISNWLERIMIERLERKSQMISDTLGLCNNNWEQTFYQSLARNFGFNTNSEAFELLAKSLPIQIIAKHKSNIFQIEALLFGQAGLLEKKFKDEYAQKLKTEYNFLKKKYLLNPIDGHLWKFLRLRPSNFPTIRIAQFADLLYKSSALFSKVIESRSLLELRELFNLQTTVYWEDHYNFDKTSTKRIKKFGDNAVNLILINTVIPFLFVYGRYKHNDSYSERLMNFLNEIPNETNAIIKKWNSIGLKTASALESQALLELKNNYCNRKRCLECSIGNKILRTA